ncbi:MULTISPECIES: LysR family transcriptional regulator [Pseudomonas syringae group]|uniref:LysR family transcriptional regulator n=3 Tax=Pseudomonas syringae group TaxID=136849 RepID=A0AAE6QLC3_9PSED|nr:MULTISPECIES: LysR family transcriptional regulator [Pseudomonas syringae group]KPX32240.1 LysR family transcriptional regulator [Pseudomonas coronafaciens pv. garcae]KPY95515.1 LysR family transcriptional regulator [Pseudomonas tremae]MCF5711069.1 LysR family transcriptional regulator [Pseudomonas tremae]MCF5744987.1 LysR family transcriptional regulator [Pseudomonas tremae]MCQ3028662.1 LysR family transcriptional regulator [Pseudomonas tremae]
MSDLSFSSFCNWLKYRHLILIDTLGRTQNMHLAAQQMNLSQPALSKMLKEIESLLGFAIFERLPRSMVPTSLGVQVVRYAQLALNDARTFVEQINNLSAGGHGHLKVGGIFAATAVVLPEAIVQIKERWPLLSIEVVEQTSDHLMEMLEERTLDLAIGRFTEKGQQQRYDFQALAPEPFSIVVNSRHPLCDAGPMSLQQLVDWPWMLYPKGTPIRGRMEAAFAEAGVGVPRNTIDTISMQTFLKVLQSGPMIGMLPDAMVAPHLESGLLRTLQTQMHLVPQFYGILTRKSEPLTGPAQEFANILLENARLVQEKQAPGS